MAVNNVMSTVEQYAYANRPDERFCRDNNLENVSLYNGLNGNHVSEIKANATLTSTEVILDNPFVNAFILIGKDRNADVSSGTGGRGHTGASCIDLVAGYMGTRPIAQLYNPETNEITEVSAGKSFINDSSRLYLTQKAGNIDEYFEIPEPYVTIADRIVPLERNTGLASAVLKSDCVRLVARENIKIVTMHGEPNSLGKSTINGGIALIAGADKVGIDPRFSPQPMVKGNNLINALTYLLDLIKNTNSSVSNFLLRQMKINAFLARHTHQSNATGLPTGLMLEQECSIENFEFNITEIPDHVTRQNDYDKFKKTFLKLDDPNSIISSFNIVN